MLSKKKVYNITKIECGYINSRAGFIVDLIFLDTNSNATLLYLLSRVLLHNISRHFPRAAHLTPGGGVPVETRLKVTGYLGLGPGGHGPAVERSQGSLIPHVETLDLA